MSSIGLPNQASRPQDLTPPGTPDQQIPFERVTQNTGVTAEADAIATESLPNGKKVSIRDIYVTSGGTSTILRVYRNGVVVLRHSSVTAGVTERVPLEEAIELDEDDTWRVTVQDGGAGVTVDVNVVGREELKKNEIFDQVIA